MPRPRIDPDERLSAQVYVTLRQKERQHLQHLQDRTGKTAASIMRAAFLTQHPLPEEPT